MKKERIEVATSKLLLNTGQLEWLPQNPRQWTKDDLEKTKASIERDPDFLEDRPILVVAFEDKFVVFGGNLRTSAAKEIKRKTMPAMFYTPETDADRETIKRRAILDNGSFGAWDFDSLANEWDSLPLNDWGVPAWSVPETKEFSGENKEIELDEDADEMELKFTLNFDEYQFINEALMRIDANKEQALLKAFGYGAE